MSGNVKKTLATSKIYINVRLASIWNVTIMKTSLRIMLGKERRRGIELSRTTWQLLRRRNLHSHWSTVAVLLAPSKILCNKFFYDEVTASCTSSNGLETHRNIILRTMYRLLRDTETLYGVYKKFNR